jgi:hypothetical protein
MTDTESLNIGQGSGVEEGGPRRVLRSVGAVLAGLVGLRTLPGHRRAAARNRNLSTVVQADERAVMAARYSQSHRLWRFGRIHRCAARASSPDGACTSARSCGSGVEHRGRCGDLELRAGIRAQMVSPGACLYRDSVRLGRWQDPGQSNEKARTKYLSLI